MVLSNSNLPIMPATKFSIVSCNLFNLNLPGLAIYRDRDGHTQELYDKKVDWLQTSIKNLNADIFGFQELWHHDALEELFGGSLAEQYDLLVPQDHSGSIVCAGAVRKENYR